MVWTKEKTTRNLYDEPTDQSSLAASKYLDVYPDLCILKTFSEKSNAKHYTNLTSKFPVQAVQYFCYGNLSEQPPLFNII